MHKSIFTRKPRPSDLSRLNKKHKHLRDCLAWPACLETSGRIIADVCGNNHGVINSGGALPTFAADSLGSYVTFTGANQNRIDIGYIDMAGWTQATIEVVFYYAGGGSNEHTLYSNWDNLNVAPGFLLRIDNSTDHLETYVRLTSGSASDTSSTTVPKNTWLRLFMVFNTTDFKCYWSQVGVNNLTQYTTVSTGASMASGPSAENSWFGASPHDATEKFLSGERIQYGRIWKRRLPITELEEIHANPWTPFERRITQKTTAGGGTTLRTLTLLGVGV